MIIERDRVVRFHYSFSGEDGQVIESSREREAVAVLQGHGNIVRGVDDALSGHVAGDTFQVTVPPEEGYGRRVDGRTQRVPKKHVRGPKRLKPGDQVVLETREGARDVTVLKVGRTVVDVDLNHPLAGQTLVFDIEILEVSERNLKRSLTGTCTGLEVTAISVLMSPGKVGLADLDDIFRGASARLDPHCRAGVEVSAAVIAGAAAGDAPVYGVNTGFGKLASVRIDKHQLATLQRNLVLSHCAGVGDALSPEVVRLVMALKLLSLGRGASGVRWALLELLQDMLDRGVRPVMPGQGSVGASGDLAPLAHLAAVMIGEGEAIVDGRRMSGQEALGQVNLQPLVLGPKEGLALINGTQVSTALALAGLFKAWRAATTSLVTGALSTDAAMGSSAPYRKDVHALRGLRGQIEVGRALRAILSGSQIRESHREGDERVQDPYCLRCQPQVLGACLDLLRQSGATLQVEANAVTDNPLVLPDGSIVSGGNFHAEPVAFAADQIAMAVAETGAIAQRRISLLVDPALSFGLPAFLSPSPGLNSGLMIAEVTSAALMSENKALANPRSVDSTPTSANQEDHVSMACHGARRLLEMTANLERIVGIEVLAGVQGVEFRAPLRTSPRLQDVIARVRRAVAPLDRDRYLAGDLETAAGLVRDGDLLTEEVPVLGD